MECVDATKTLTEGSVYTSKRFIKVNGNIITHGVKHEDATHVLLKNDDMSLIRAKINRFKVDE